MQRRRVTGLVLCGLGATLIILAPLLRWWVGPALTKSPVGGDIVSDASGENITYFDFTHPEKGEQTGTVRSREVYHGKVKDSTATVAVYTLDAETYYTDEPDLPRDLNASQQRFAVDRKTALAVPDPKNQEQVDTDVNNSYAKHSGLILKFPINTEKKSYPFWDARIRSSEHPMEFRGEERLVGLRVYRFEQTIPDTDLSAQVANLHYATHRVAWVEPVTGVIIKGEQTVTATLGAPGGTKTTLLSGTLTFTDDNVAASAQRAREALSTIAKIRVTLPLVGLLLGLVALAAGLLLVRSPKTPTGAAGPRHGVPGPPSSPGPPTDEQPTATFRVV